MVTSHRLHKLSGLVAGIVLFILALSGFVLDHDYWKPFYTIRFSTDSQVLLQKERRLITSKIVTDKAIYVASMRGIYEKKGTTFAQTLALPTLALFANEEGIFAATSEGIYIRRENGWIPFALEKEVVTAISGDEEKLVAVVDKKELVVLDYDGHILHRSGVAIEKEKLVQGIKLSRLLRDLHYGRGLFDNGISLVLNDYAALVLLFLSSSGYLIWFLIRKKSTKKVKPLIKLHANILTLSATVIMLLLAFSGIYLDHASFFGKYTKNIDVPRSLLPPVYNTLREDIWSVALYENKFYIGNRVGVFASEDLENWEKVSVGFGYSLSRVDEKLFIGGMGSPNRVCEAKNCKIIPDTPHMFKQAFKTHEGISFLSSHAKDKSLPHFRDISLYTLMLSLHDGSFFASWWIWINDIAAVLLFVLITTGSYRWWKKKRVFKWYGRTDKFS